MLDERMINRATGSFLKTVIKAGFSRNSLLRMIDTVTGCYDSPDRWNRLIKEIVKTDKTKAVKVLETLVFDESSRLRYKVAGSINTPESVLKMLASRYSKDRTVCECLAKNNNTPKHLLTALASDENWIVRREVAKNSNTPKSELRFLARDKNCNVRSSVACNNNAPKSVLKILAHDEEWAVRRSIADNANTSESTLKVLACDKDIGARIRVLNNNNTTDSVLEILEHDKDAEIRFAARCKLKARKERA